jgi:hypothetical protein
MGYVVCHIQKPKGNDAGTSAHIERRVHPANADQSREYLNEQLVEYPDGVENRTQAIQHRIETAGITRKIGTNQVRALRIMLSGSPEDMQRIVATGRLNEWCADNLKWLRDTFGADNIVSADLHRDEQTPTFTQRSFQSSPVKEEQSRQISRLTPTGRSIARNPRTPCVCVPMM